MAYRELRYVPSSGDPETVGDPRMEGALADIESLRTIGGIVVDTDYTGGTDASAAINAAIVQAYSDGGGSTGYSTPVILKAGTLRLDSPITARARTTLIGAGKKATILRPYGSITAIEAAVVDGTVKPDDMVFAHFQIDGAAQTGTSGSPWPKGMYFTDSRRLLVEDVLIQNTWATGFGIDYITGVISNCWAISCGRQNAARAAGSWPGSSGIGIGTKNMDSTGTEMLTITGCHTAGNSNYGIFLETQGTDSPAGVQIIGCTAYDNGQSGIGECGSTGTSIIGNTCYGNDVAGISLDGGTIGAGKPGRHTLVQGNHCYGNGVGIRAYATGTDSNDVIVAPHITANTVRGNTAEGILVSPATSGSQVHKWGTIAGNVVSENGSHGIRLGVGGQNLARFAVTRNRVWNNTGTGILVDGPTTDLRVTYNEVWGEGATQATALNVSTTYTHTGFVNTGNDNEGTVTVP